MTALRRYRIQNDISAQKAAKALGISRGALSRYETGSKFPRPEILLKIRKWSGGQVTADDILNKRFPDQA